MKGAKSIQKEAKPQKRWNTQNLKRIPFWGLMLILSLMGYGAQAQLQLDQVAPLFPVLTFPTTTKLLSRQRFYVAPVRPMVQPAPIPKFRHQAFFCRLEDRWLVNNHFPLRFRLGTVAYTDALEGK